MNASSSNPELSFNCSNISLIPASFWFKPQRFYILNHTCEWPWIHLALSTWHSIITDLTQYAWRWEKAVISVGLFFVFLGLIGNISIILIISSVPKKSLISCYVVLLVIACLDAAYLTLIGTGHIIKITRSDSISINRDIALHTASAAYTLSLISDLTAVALTMERFTALTFPVYYKTLTFSRKRVAWVIAGGISLFMGVSRLHYSFDSFLYSSNMRNYHWFIAISFFSDTVIPILLTVSMIILTVGIIRVLRNRKLKHPNRHDPTETKTMEFLAVMLVMFFINQTGYILYACLYMGQSRWHVAYSSPMEEINEYVAMLYIYYGGSYLTSPVEVISRSLHFYTYMVFCQRFRGQYSRVMKRCLGYIKKHN